MKVHTSQQGFTLIELMISLVLGLILLLASISIVVSSLTQLRNTQAFSEILDNGRVAMAMMGRDVAHAGFMGELSGQNLVVDSNVTVEAGAVSGECAGDGINNESFPEADSVATFRTLWGETVSSSSALGCISDARSGTDVIQVKRLIGFDDTSSAIVGSNRIYMVANSASGVIFNGNTGLAATEPSNGQYYEYQHRVYYIANTTRYGQSNFPLLVRETLNVVSGTPTMVREEIAEGVEDLRVLYGIDDDGNGSVDRYTTADLVDDDEWDHVDYTRIVSVQIGMLMRSIEADESFVRGGTASYSYAGESATSEADGIRRKVITSTLAVRNYQIANGA